MATTIELERTYLLTETPIEIITSISPIPMMDIYIPGHGVDHPHLRLRQKGDNYVITKKYPSAQDATKQVEETIELDIGEFNALNNCSNATVEKLRYSTEIDDTHVDIDIFQGKLKGLMLADFEFNDEQSAKDFVAPEWVGAEVSNVDFLAGGLLAGKSYGDISAQLDNLKKQ